jgi:PhnB protein
MHVNTYLAFSGNCKTAFETYAKVLGGKIAFMMTQGESPMADKVPPAMKNKIMHASLELPGGGAILGADHPEGKEAKPHGFSVCVTVKDAAEAERIFKGLSEGGQVQMPFEKTFWSPGFGMCIDKFEVPWMVNTEGPMPS